MEEEMKSKYQGTRISKTYCSVCDRAISVRFRKSAKLCARCLRHARMGVL